MKIPWSGCQCIICLQDRPLSEEHVIPRSLGGDLTCNFICKPCNDLFGSTFEASAKIDPVIRLAAGYLRDKLPAATYQQIEDGQLWTAKNGPVPVRAIYRAGSLIPKPFRHTDGSLMVPTKDAAGHIERMATRRGYGSEIVRAAAASVASMPERMRIELLPGISLINWPTDEPMPDLSGRPLDDLVLVKTAFEFVALILDTAIYADTPHLGEIREALTGNSKAGGFRVERFMASDYASFHGVCFEGNDPHARIQIRLFGKLAFRIHFLHLALDAPKIVYTHNLKTGDHDFTRA